MAVDWKPVSKPALIGGGLAALAFMLYAALKPGGFLILDYVNLPIHEAGHLVFGIFGATLAVWGGTLLQIIFPFAFLIYFRLRVDPAGTFFSAFWTGESLIYSSVYIGDARAMQLPLVGGGEHDWNNILSGLGLLAADGTIADVVLLTGWAILILSWLWFIDRGRKSLAAGAGASDSKLP
jgi:hypothetical protein